MVKVLLVSKLDDAILKTYGHRPTSAISHPSFKPSDFCIFVETKMFK